ncbi:hypothetical protein AGR4A_pAt30187 [Agrobacterium tumefaciens str. B6]|uniref:Uncharacterized protein n=1 Tax=Agrobacterium tumefaciens str. B6 TaxID=1183423 RepID=A0A822V795_AGRTU|nr:hypothetical protein AGR4A_pAt30187 [Agrobacterium tumefaciens str. B6]
MARGGLGSTEGISHFSPDEINRRHQLVIRALEARGLDALVLQAHFPPTVMGCHPKLTWLTG